MHKLINALRQINDFTAIQVLFINIRINIRMSKIHSLKNHEFWNQQKVLILMLLLNLPQTNASKSKFVV